MRVLYENKLKDANFTGNANANFGLGNLLVPSLSIPFVGIDKTAEIVVTFDTEVPITCIAFAGHNLETFRYRLFDTSNTIVEDVLVVALNKSEMIYPVVKTAKKLVLNLSAYEGKIAQCGNLMVGEYLQMPNPAPYYDETLVMTNVRSETAFGQVYGSDGVFVQTYSPDFEHVELDKFNEVVTMCETVRNFHPVYVDMTELNHAYKKPLYATMSGSDFSNKRDTRGFQRRTFSLKIREVF